jgi:hypothetical protein
LKVLLSDRSETPASFLAVLPGVHYQLKELQAEAPALIVFWIVVARLAAFRPSSPVSTAPQLVLVQVLNSDFDSGLNLQFVQWQ